LRRTPIQELELPEASFVPTLSQDENLVLALRLRDGVPNRMPQHRNTGACKYLRFYADGGDCEWCRALEAREAVTTPAEIPSNVIVMSLRRPHAGEDAVPARRIA
jgi:hypothetical protein